ncbi:MAG TPA: hypothetical protein VEH31_21050 [Streptosporangiaceae bacterium]|nr:hypothetical protein [Streptosporangiaceae bacterium]
MPAAYEDRAGHDEPAARRHAAGRRRPRSGGGPAWPGSRAGQRGVSGPGRKAGPWPGTITVATARMRSLLRSSAAWSAPSGSTAGPSAAH